MSAALSGHGWNTTSQCIWQQEQRWRGGFTVPYSIRVIFHSCHHKSQQTTHEIKPTIYLQRLDIFWSKQEEWKIKAISFKSPDPVIQTSNWGTRSAAKWFVGHQRSKNTSLSLSWTPYCICFVLIYQPSPARKAHICTFATCPKFTVIINVNYLLHLLMKTGCKQLHIFNPMAKCLIFLTHIVIPIDIPIMHSYY